MTTHKARCMGASDFVLTREHYHNQELKRSHYPLHLVDEYLSDLSQITVFSKADLQE